MSLELKSLTLTEGLNELPRISLELRSEYQYASMPTKDLMVSLGSDIECTEIYSRGNKISLALFNENAFKCASSYLGNTLNAALKSLNLRTKINDPDGIATKISGNFYQVNECPWGVFNRLKYYLPTTYHLVCGIDAIHIISKPKESLTVSEPQFTKVNNYERAVLIDPVVSSNNNPSFMYSNLPITSLMNEYIDKLQSKDIVVNYTQSKYYQNDYLDRLIYITSKREYILGNGLMIDGYVYTVVGKSSTSDLKSSMIGNVYTCMIME